MAVRNFWVEGRIEGRAGTLTGGPAGVGRGMVIRIAQRENGASVDAVEVRSWVAANGELITQVNIDGREVGRKVTCR